MGKHRLRGKAGKVYRDHVRRVCDEYTPERYGDPVTAALVRKAVLRELWFIFDKHAQHQYLITQDEQ